MRNLFLISTLAFWLAVGGLWVAAPDRPPPVADPSPRDETYGLAEVARHATQEDCWMAIGGIVYDFTTYLPVHPASPALMLAWCGKEASEAYRTKTRGRPHSPYADTLLPRYRIGVLVP
ncbi:MAG: cytochrome b5 domain-containing protein [Ectothiorhodospiraceae bacterium]|nr:cytochrome b5 domain-containing protein [Ectothiorhodospiraceae bacterium]